MKILLVLITQKHYAGFFENTKLNVKTSLFKYLKHKSSYCSDRLCFGHCSLEIRLGYFNLKDLHKVYAQSTIDVLGSGLLYPNTNIDLSGLGDKTSTQN